MPCHLSWAFLHAKAPYSSRRLVRDGQYERIVMKSVSHCFKYHLCPSWACVVHMLGSSQLDIPHSRQALHSSLPLHAERSPQPPPDGPHRHNIAIRFSARTFGQHGHTACCCILAGCSSRGNGLTATATANPPERSVSKTIAISLLSTHLWPTWNMYTLPPQLGGGDR